MKKEKVTTIPTTEEYIKSRYHVDNLDDVALGGTSMSKMMKDYTRLHVQEVESIQSWSVTWYRRYDIFSSSVTECKEFFFTEETAESFAKALRDAYKLLRHTSGTDVKVKKELI